MGQDSESEAIGCNDASTTIDLPQSLDSVIASLAACAGHERRTHPRGRMSVPVQVIPLDNQENTLPQEAVQAWSTTLSRTGISFRHRHRFGFRRVVVEFHDCRL